MRCFRIKSKVTLGTNTSSNLGGSLVFLFHGGTFVSIPWNVMFDSQGVPLQSLKELGPPVPHVQQATPTCHGSHLQLKVNNFVASNPIENISQIGSFAQVGLKVIKAFETTAQVVCCSLVPCNL